MNKLFSIINTVNKQEVQTYGELISTESPKTNIVNKLSQEEKEVYEEIQNKDKERLIDSAGNNREKDNSITFNKPNKKTVVIPGIGEVTQMM